MTTQTRIPGRPDWASGPLYSLMLDIFPEHRTKLGVLDIPRLTTELGKSHEAIYKWLRQGKLKPSNAHAIVNLASQPGNAAELKRLDRDPPKFEDFLPFFI